MFIERKSTLDHNISNLYGLVWDHCTQDPKENIFGLYEYRVNSKEYDWLWMFQQLKSSTSGADNPNMSTYLM